MRSLRILIASNAGWAPSGYGTAILSLAQRLKAMGHETAVSAFFGLQGGQIEWEGIHHYPAGYKPYGRDVIPLHARDWQADIVITLIDVWVLDPNLHKYCRLCTWAPIDHKPVPRRVAERMRDAWAILSWTQFAVDELKKIGLNSYYVPLGVETDVMRPYENRQEVRDKFGVPEDAFVVGMVAANQTNYPTRKGFERIMPAVRNLLNKGYDDLILYVHALPTPEIGGINMLELIQSLGLEDNVYLPRPDVYPMGGLDREGMADLYNTFDLYAMPSNAEGFGLPLVEAQACGTPAIATNFTTMPELCASGWLIKPAAYYMSPLLAWQSLADISSIEERIVYAYDHRDELKQKGKEAREFAKQYDWDKIAEENWRPMLEEFGERIDNENNSYNQMPNIDNMQEPFLDIDVPDNIGDIDAPDIELPDMGAAEV